MLQTRLWQSLKSLSAHKLTAFGKFLSSPYFNQREDLSRIFATIEVAMGQEEELSKAQLWSTVFPQQPFKEQNLRLLMTYLQRLFEQFIAVENVLQDKISIKLQTAAWFREQGMEKLHKSVLKDSHVQIEKQPLRSAEYFFHQFQYELEKYRTASQTKPDKSADFQQVTNNLDLAFIGMKLRQSCLMMVHDRVYHWGFDAGFLPQIFEYLEGENLLNFPAIGIYYYCYRMLEEPEEEFWFQSFKKVLLDSGDLFAKEEMQDLYLLAINYGIRRANDGHRNYFQDIIDFYRIGLAKEYLLQGGELSRFTYNNVVSIALQINLTDWAESFIEEWAPRLEKRYRERMFNFNRAKIAYHRKDYDAAIPLLQRANYHDLLLNLRARTLLLKIYHELEEFDLLHSHLDAFNSYLRRKSGLGYHRKNYRNLIKYTGRLLALNVGDRKAVAGFEKAVIGEGILTEKDWLLSRINT